MVSVLSMFPISITIWVGLAMAFEAEWEQSRYLIAEIAASLWLMTVNGSKESHTVSASKSMKMAISILVILRMGKSLERQ